MDSDAGIKAQIVDLLQYKAERGQRFLNFDGPAAPPRPVLAAVRPFRPLSARELAHRQRMVRHLGISQKLEVRSQK
jgi:hypothetical protein